MYIHYLLSSCSHLFFVVFPAADLGFCLCCVVYIMIVAATPFLFKADVVTTSAAFGRLCWRSRLLFTILLLKPTSLDIFVEATNHNIAVGASVVASVAIMFWWPLASTGVVDQFLCVTYKKYILRMLMGKVFPVCFICTASSIFCLLVSVF